jgi:hypothetical protein
MGETTRDTLDQADEDILTPTVSDEALEATTNLNQAHLGLSAGHDQPSGALHERKNPSVGVSSPC